MDKDGTRLNHFEWLSNLQISTDSVDMHVFSIKSLVGCCEILRQIWFLKFVALPKHIEKKKTLLFYRKPMSIHDAGAGRILGW